MAASGASNAQLAPWLQAMELMMGGKEVSRTTGQPLTGVPSTCLNCFARCGIIGYVREGWLVKIGGNPAHPNSRGKMCAKGQAGLNTLYDPDRILYPLKRIGPRGSGEFVRISWEEALSQLATALKTLRQKGRSHEFVFQSDRDITTQKFIQRFLAAFGTPNGFIHAPLGNNNKRGAQLLTWGEEVEINDVANTHYMLNFGSNPFEAHILRTSFAQRLTEGRVTKIIKDRVHYGAKLVSFDVRLSQTAGKSDEWFPIFPGTDGAVALAMAHVIMREGLYDRDFFLRWINYPPDKLIEHLRPYTPEFAQRMSGISAEDIKRVALEFATSQSATTISTGGVSKHFNGVYNERCVMLLNAITGNIDIKGGFCRPRAYEFVDPLPHPPQPPLSHGFSQPSFALLLQNPLGYTMTSDKIFELIKAKAPQMKVSVYITYQYNPVYSAPQGTLAEEVLKDEKLIPLYVALSSNMTESVALADIILPTTTYLERWELESPPAMDLVPFLSLRQPLVKPLGQTRSLMDIFMELAQRVGGGMEAYFPFSSVPDFLRASLPSVNSLGSEQLFAKLKEDGFYLDPTLSPQYCSYEQEGFKTPSGKFEIYSERLEKAGFHPLPVYEPIEHHQNLADEELILTTYQWNVHTHCWTANSMWLAEIVHNNPVWLNPETARKLGIQDGDKIRVDSSAGSIETRVFLTQGIHPKVVAIGDSCGHWGYGHIAQGQRFKSYEPNTELIWWGKEAGGTGTGKHPNPIIPIRPDPIGGGQAWMDTVVKIRRA